MDLTPALQNTLNPDDSIRHQAEEFLKQAQETNLPVFMVSLVVELANENKPPASRQAAGLRLKNLLEAKDEARQRQLAEQWTRQSDDVKTQVRTQVLLSLHSPNKDARKTAAQALSSLASIELPQNQWVTVVGDLVRNVTEPKSEFGVESSLMAIGYLCEECRTPALVAQSNVILTAVIQGMRKEQTNNEIRLAGTEALLNALEFVKQNFENEAERSFIMTVTCEASIADDYRIRVAAMQCLVRIANIYYDFLPQYIEALFNITIKAAKADREEVALQAVEFWSTVAELEAEIKEDIQYAKDNDEEPERTLHGFVNSALKPLVEMLTELMVRQEEDQTEDDWNVSMSAGKCLSLMARVAGNNIVPITMPFISAHIGNTDWHFREAAVLAFSAVLEGPESSDDMKKLVKEAIPLMLKHVHDPVTMVKDTTVFTIGRIAQFHPDPLIDFHLTEVLEALVFATKDEDPAVASKACWAIHNVAEAFEEESDKPTYKLSPYFQLLTGCLITVFDREDIDEGKLRINSYGAFNSLISSASRDQYQFLITLVPVILTRLGASIQAFNQTFDKKQREDISRAQGFLCTSLQTLAHKLRDSVKQYSDDIMKALLSLFSLNRAVHEEIMLAIGTLAMAVQEYFDRYMQHFLPILLQSLKNQEEVQMCSVAISVVSDLCLALRVKMTNYSDAIMEVLLANLHNPNIDRSIKPSIISCFGDIALAIGPHFERYMKYVSLILCQASEAQVDANDVAMVDYLNQLRENIFDSYSNILQGLKGGDNYRIFDPCVDNLVNFLKIVAADKNIDEIVFRSAVNVIGDLANVYGSKVKHLLQSPEIMDMVKDATKAGDKDTKNIAKWVQKELQRI